MFLLCHTYHRMYSYLWLIIWLLQNFWCSTVAFFGGVAWDTFLESIKPAAKSHKAEKLAMGCKTHILGCVCWFRIYYHTGLYDQLDSKKKVVILTGRNYSSKEAKTRIHQPLLEKVHQKNTLKSSTWSAWWIFRSFYWPLFFKNHPF